MSRDQWWVVTYTNGDEEEFYGSPQVSRDGVLIMTMRGGVTGAVIEETMVPLTAIRKWRAKEQQ